MRSERKVVTVLFADIKRSIDLVARRDPEQAGEVLEQVVAHMGEQVRRFGGLVSQILGDGIMALFGAPLAIEDHAAQACHAALAMRDVIHATVRPRVEIRVGLSSGEVVVRAVSDDVSLHYSATGEPVHFASRMEGAAGPDQILLTPSTLALAGNRAEVRGLGAIPLKGLDAPHVAFELLGMRRRRADPARAAFVGRDRELAQLEGALAAAEAGEPAAIRVVAEAGCGKSRLVREFTADRLTPEWARWQAEAVSYRRTSYGVLVELLTAAFGLHADDPAAERREKTLAALDLVGEDDMLAPLAELLGFAAPAGWPNLPARERRQRTIAAAAEALGRASRRRPSALVVEDAHWLDPESAESIGRLAGAGHGPKLLTIATERPPDSPFAGLEAWRECQLPPLDGAATHALLSGLLLPGPEVRALERRLLAHTSGNPLFIEECLQSLVETGELARVGGHYRIERPVDLLGVPHSLRGLLDARVDRLPAGDKDVLQAASVLGTQVPEDLLRTVLDLPDPAALRPALDRLCTAGFLVEAGSAAAATPRSYAFRHGLIRDAAYNGILLRNRVRMHRAVLDALEGRGSGAEQSDLLADHAFQAEAWPKAVAYARTAAARALDRYANPESARFYKQAIAAAAHTEEPAERERTLLGLHIDIRYPLFRLGHVHDLRPHLDEAAALADRHSDHEQLGQSQAFRSHVLWLAGKPQEAEAAAEEARRIAARHADRALAVRAEFQSALIHLSGSRIPALIAGLNQVLDHLGPAPPRRGPYSLDADIAVTALSYICRAHAAAGEFAAGRHALERARALAEGGPQQGWIYVHTAEGVLLTAEGRPHHAAAVLQRALETCTKADMRLLRPVACGFLGLALIESGRVGPGREAAQESVMDAEQMGFVALHPLRLAILAQGELLLGHLDAADAAASRARLLAQEVEEPGAEAYATGLLGEVARRREDKQADGLFTSALRQAEALGLRPLAASLRQRLDDPANRAHPWLDGVALAP